MQNSNDKNGEDKGDSRNDGNDDTVKIIINFWYFEEANVTYPLVFVAQHASRLLTRFPTTLHIHLSLVLSISLPLSLHMLATRFYFI